MKIFRIAAAGAIALLTWGCFLSPGKFDASLDLRRNGSFRYTYAGEMILAVPGAGGEAADPPFDPEGQVCTGPSDGATGADDAEDIFGESRDCTPAEIEEKRKEWEAGRAERIAGKKRDAEMARSMFGGIDPADTRTMDEFARRLQGQSGFRRIQHKGNGIFDVEYELSGRLDHDFVFPVFPDVDLVLPFVKVHRLTGNRVRIVAPAFVQQQEGFKGMGGMFAGDKPGATLPRPQGNFTITTDAQILTNNTQDGPTGGAAARVLKWVIGPLDNKKPEALLQL